MTSPLARSFLCLKNHVGGRNDNDKKADVILHPKIYLTSSSFYFHLFLNSLSCSFTSNLFALGVIPPSLTKDLGIFFLPFLNLFSSVPLGKKGEGWIDEAYFLMSDSLGTYLISLSTCHTCLLLWLSPFERVGAEQPDIGEALAEFRFNNLAHFFHLCVFLDLGGTFLFLFTPTPWCFLCEKKETSSGP